MTKIFASFLILISLSAPYGCNSRSKEVAAELTLLDSLDARLAASGSWLVLDAEEIEKRYIQMEENYRFFSAHFKDTVTLELALALDQYKGILPIYANYVKHHKAIEIEHATLVKQVHNLRKSLLNSDVNRTDFRMYYAKESDDATALAGYIDDTFKKVIEVEPMFKRCTPIVHAQVESLRRTVKKP